MKKSSVRAPVARVAGSPSVRALADVVLAYLRHARTGDAQARRSGLSPDLLSALTDQFVDAGVRSLVEAPSLPTWQQLGVAFAPGRASQDERARFGEALRRAIVRWRARGVVGRVFFMDKPPGMRLRFETTTGAPAARTRGLVESWLCRQACVARVERSLYLAETYQFGGSAAADVAHDFHAADSLHALQAIHRDQRGDASASLEILSLLVVCDLARRMTDDAWEAWDLWKRMDLTGRLPRVSRETAAAMIALVRPFVLEPELVLRRLASADRRLLASAYQANERAATAMRRLAAEGQLLFHVREIIPFWIIFHWNRWGIVNQRALTIGIEGALDPRTP